ncbi:hypothetical protein [uncultured Corynebacterium sp.]|uniref:hypothetical protein n=1 Tax=uncultured Corynebacterium sp. TaxID=159447 RepID=UPI0025FF29EB|nr:hypothetical protein [uncultured Corynebacterium sp.]
MVSLNSESLQTSAQGFIRQWFDLQGRRRQDDRYDPAEGAMVTAGAHYTTEGSRFLLKLDIDAFAENMTFNAGLLVGYSYETTIDVEHEEALTFMQSHLGPLAFAIINEELSELGRKFAAPFPRLSPQHQLDFWLEQRELTQDEMTLNVEGSPDNG